MSSRGRGRGVWGASSGWGLLECDGGMEQVLLLRLLLERAKTLLWIPFASVGMTLRRER